MTTTSISSEPLSSSYLSSYTSGASLHSFARRHSIYGTEDRVVLDIGSLYIKCGFSGESHPRHIIPTWSRLKRSQSSEGEAFRIDAEPVELYDTVIYAPDARESTSFQDFEEKLKRLLHDIYFRHLLTDPKSRKVIICESPLTPIAVKQTIAKLLFQYFQVPSISFVPIHLMALMTTGKTTGLIVECGNLETTILPIYAARPLYPFIVSTPRAGRSLSKRLKELLLSHGRLIPPSHLHLSLAPQHPIPETVLTTELIEDLKTRVLFCSPILMSHDDSVDKIDAYKSFSSATDVYYPVMLKDGTKATLLIPGWIRERAADVLFEGDDEDEPGVAQCVLECLLKLQPDLRRPLISALLFNGGTAALPGFTSRLRQELMRIMREPTPYENRKYGALRRLQKDVRFIDNPEDIKTAGRIFCSSIRGWIGGSLIGSLKLSGEEIVREKYNGIVTDWSIGNWSSTTNGVSNNSATSTTDSTMSYRTSQKDAFAH